MIFYRTLAAIVAAAIVAGIGYWIWTDYQDRGRADAERARLQATLRAAADAIAAQDAKDAERNAALQRNTEALETQTNRDVFKERQAACLELLRTEGRAMMLNWPSPEREQCFSDGYITIHDVNRARLAVGFGPLPANHSTTTP